MALKRAALCCVAVAATLLATGVRAQDRAQDPSQVPSMGSPLDKARLGRDADKAREVRDQILEKRRGQPAGTAVRPDAKAVVEDPFEESVRAAREKVAALDVEIDEKRRQGQALAAPRDKLQARSDELGAQVQALQEQNRARVEAVYRSAKLGAGAAGWHPDPARSARLSRYLASIAEVQQKKLEVVEVEHGSVIASLDKARGDDAAAAGALRVLEADRAEALAGLDRVLADAGAPRRRELTPEEAEAEAEAIGGGQAAADSGVETTESAAADERAMALLQARKGSAGVEPAPAGDLEWPSGAAPGAAPTDAEAAARALEEAQKLEEAKLAMAARAEETRIEAEANEAAAKAKAEADAKARAEAEAKSKADAEAKAKAEAEAKRAAEIAKEDAHGASRELDDGPAVLASSKPAGGEQVASVPSAQPGEPSAQSGADSANNQGARSGDAGASSGDADAASGEADKTKRPNLFSRMFGGDRESDAFASARGNLPPPVAGKVVANYGQQHKSGATYRGVILRAGDSAPIKAVAGGKVSFAGNVPGLGNTVIVSHGGRYHTVYARLGTVEVKEGDSVAGGTEVGKLPDDDADMHFELRDQGKAVDPVPWLKGGIPGAAAQ